MTVKDPKEFWEIAQTFPDNKEAVYPDHVVAQEFALNVGKTVLEYGCGGGSDTLSYLRRGCSIYFADIVRGNVLATARAVTAAGYGGKQAKPLHLAHSSALNGIPSGHLDVVSAHGVLHHIAEYHIVLDVLAEFHRVLRPTGRLYVMLYTKELWEKYQLQIDKLMVKGLTAAQAFGQLTDGEGCPHAIAYDSEDGKQLLSTAGFNVVSEFIYNGGDFRTFRAVPQ